MMVTAIAPEVTFLSPQQEAPVRQPPGVAVLALLRRDAAPGAPHLLPPLLRHHRPRAAPLLLNPKEPEDDLLPRDLRDSSLNVQTLGKL